MVRDHLIVGVAALPDAFVQTVFEDVLRKTGNVRDLRKAADVLVDLLRDCARKHAGVGPRIGDELLFIKLLRDLQRLVRADLQAPRAGILQLRKVE